MLFTNELFLARFFLGNFFHDFLFCCGFFLRHGTPRLFLVANPIRVALIVDKLKPISKKKLCYFFIFIKKVSTASLRKESAHRSF